MKIFFGFNQHFLYLWGRGGLIIQFHAIDWNVLLQNTKISHHMLEVLIIGRMKNGVLFILKR